MTDTPARVDTTRLQHIARAYTETAVLYSAIDAQIFSYIHKGRVTEEALAEATGLHKVDIDRLVTCLLSMDLLQWTATGELANADDVDKFLVKGSPRYAGPWMTFTRRDVPDWFDMTRLMREGEPTLLGMYDDLTVDAAKKYHQATSSIGFGAARRFVRDVDLSGRRHLLDLGGGSGAYSITSVRAFDDLSATVLDLPPVVEATKEYILDHDVVGRVDTHGADFTKGEFPSPADNPVDVVVMASNLPIYDGETIGSVVARAFRALAPGGEMHLIGEMLNNDRCGPIDAAMWGMNELICGSLGRAHTRAECVSYFDAAGFTDVEVSEFVPGVLARCHGTKPA
ncbi:MAG: ubiquinone/menaquinone biosynthesis C-methylase UbiE [Candidatus Poriferisodalaceae bacterium]|jgi:ubiquinone/menaquinone biosynthesis C-methylase UbiE